MFIYFAILSLLIYLIYRYDIKNYPKGKDAWINAFMVILILLAGLRYHIGVDTVHYESQFYDIPELQDILRDANLWSQPLWELLMSLVKTLTGSFVIFQFVHAIIFNTLLFRFLKRTTDKIFTALLFILCICWWHMSFEVLREALCVVIYLNALFYLKERNFSAYLLLGVIMLGIHHFSFVIMLITPIITILKPKYALPIVLIFAFFIYNNLSLINYIGVTSLAFADEGIAEHMQYYIESDVYGDNHQNFWGLLRILLMSILLPAITIIYSQRNDNMIFLNRILLLVPIVGILQTKMLIFFRLNSYLDILLIVCFVNVLYHSLTIKPIIKTSLYILVSLQLYFGCSTFYRPYHIEYRPNINYNCAHIPYKTIFQEPDPIRENLQ